MFFLVVISDISCRFQVLYVLKNVKQLHLPNHYSTNNQNKGSIWVKTPWDISFCLNVLFVIWSWYIFGLRAASNRSDCCSVQSFKVWILTNNRKKPRSAYHKMWRSCAWNNQTISVPVPSHFPPTCPLSGSLWRPRVSSRSSVSWTNWGSWLWRSPMKVTQSPCKNHRWRSESSTSSITSSRGNLNDET